MHPYLPHTDEEIKQMMETIGVTTLEALFDDIPGELRLEQGLRLERGCQKLRWPRKLGRLQSLMKPPKRR